jgi:hypothetical protein
VPSTKKGMAIEDWRYNLSKALSCKKINMQSSTIAKILAEGKIWKKIWKMTLTEKNCFSTSPP